MSSLALGGRKPNTLPWPPAARPSDISGHEIACGERAAGVPPVTKELRPGLDGRTFHDYAFNADTPAAMGQLHKRRSATVDMLSARPVNSGMKLEWVVLFSNEEQLLMCFTMSKMRSRTSPQLLYGTRWYELGFVDASIWDFGKMLCTYINRDYVLFPSRSIELASKPRHSRVVIEFLT